MTILLLRIRSFDIFMAVEMDEGSKVDQSVVAAGQDQETQYIPHRQLATSNPQLLNRHRQCQQRIPSM